MEVLDLYLLYAWQWSEKYLAELFGYNRPILFLSPGISGLSGIACLVRVCRLPVEKMNRENREVFRTLPGVPSLAKPDEESISLLITGHPDCIALLTTETLTPFLALLMVRLLLWC